MNDLISRAALLEDMQKELEKAVNDEEMTEYECKVLMTSALALKTFVNRQSAVDAKPVVHGKWKRKTDYDENDNAIFECSNCMSSDVHAKSTIVPFCWHCGARMDGELYEIDRCRCS